MKKVDLRSPVRLAISVFVSLFSFSQGYQPLFSRRTGRC